ncbi:MULTISPECIES: hypothetical protein [unclassified Rathayibacter]|uniref:hypothetical protein n=1 Tax=unclassified Rathayibacter TaxID=2609250 RepID=UPI0006FAC91B|nr:MULTISPECIES: hypothetical protein [unclassified Rathayibacter]KQQ03423.1 hypothetical protein ASF42_07825 [Rathayibacter sp. Leaf294]KQS11878.1 hypothetical protein ASG06_07825 [Rathayibacter sp. Leaf185]
MKFVVRDVPSNGRVETRRVWDDYNNCVRESYPLDDQRTWLPAFQSSVIDGSLYWESTDCSDESSRLHWALDFYVDDVKVDTWLVNSTYKRGPFGGQTVACYGPYDSATTPVSHVSCSTAGELRDRSETLAFSYGAAGAPAASTTTWQRDPAQNDSLIQVNFRVIDTPSTMEVRAQRIWDSENNCVYESTPLSDIRTFVPTREDSHIINGSLPLYVNGTGSCAFEFSVLRWRLDFYNLGDERIATYIVRFEETVPSIAFAQYYSESVGPLDSPDRYLQVTNPTGGQRVHVDRPDDFQLYQVSRRF